VPRPFAVSLAPLLFLSLASAAPRPKDKDGPKPYHATRLGTTLVYADGGREWTTEVTAVEEKAGETLVTLSEFSAGKTVFVERASVSAKGVFRVQVGLFQVDPLCDLRFPVKEGDTWETHVAPQKGLVGQTATITVGRVEEVETPAGKFQAVRVEMVVTAQNGRRLDPPVKYTKWFDPDLGLVKMTGGSVTRVLKSFTLGK
jgi:hypothetical protein